ncbi:MAG: hypothetical protein ABSF60_07025 [Verrucomicrobiota bacterium]|jgi:hypothetical protein
MGSCGSVTRPTPATAPGDVPDKLGTGDIAVDPKTHTVWVAYPKGDHCFVQPFTPGR